MRCRVATSAAMACVLLSASPHARQTSPDCRVSGSLVRLEGLPEASGLAASAVDDDRLWLHNDSGKPELIAVTRKGAPVGRLAINGATLEDWEALASGPCGSDHCLYIGDIGDNDAARPRVTVYRVREPRQASGSVKVDAVFHATYPDGRHDAEALLAAPDGRLHVVTKGETGFAALYRFPANLDANGTHKLERVGKLSDEPVPQPRRITDGAVSPDGKWVALRTRTSVSLYSAADFFNGTFKAARTIDLKSLGEPQGEAIAFSSTGAIFLGGEGGGKKQPGTLGTLTCGG